MLCLDKAYSFANPIQGNLFGFCSSALGNIKASDDGSVIDRRQGSELTSVEIVENLKRVEATLEKWVGSFNAMDASVESAATQVASAKSNIAQLLPAQSSALPTMSRSQGHVHEPIISMPAIKNALTLEDVDKLEKVNNDEIKSLKAQISSKDKLLSQSRNANNGEGKGEPKGDQGKAPSKHDNDWCCNCGKTGRKSWEGKCNENDAKRHQAEKRRRREIGRAHV